MPLFTDVKITILNRGELLAVASLTAGNALRLRGIRIVQGKKEVFVSMPAKKMADGVTFVDTFNAINPEVRRELKDTVMQAYQQALKVQKTGDEMAEEELAASILDHAEGYR